MNIEDIARSTTGPLRTGKDCPTAIVNQRILVQTKLSFSLLVAEHDQKFWTLG